LTQNFVSFIDVLQRDEKLNSVNQNLNP